jgi:hypothetical protein
MEVAQRNSLAVTLLSGAQLRLTVNAPGVETGCDIDYPVYVDTSNVRNCRVGTQCMENPHSK